MSKRIFSCFSITDHRPFLHFTSLVNTSCVWVSTCMNIMCNERMCLLHCDVDTILFYLLICYGVCLAESVHMFECVCVCVIMRVCMFGDYSMNKCTVRTSAVYLVLSHLYISQSDQSKRQKYGYVYISPCVCVCVCVFVLISHRKRSYLRGTLTPNVSLCSLFDQNRRVVTSQNKWWEKCFREFFNDFCNESQLKWKLNDVYISGPSLTYSWLPTLQSWRVCGTLKIRSHICQHYNSKKQSVASWDVFISL